jgi:hypothetical protein
LFRCKCKQVIYNSQNRKQNTVAVILNNCYILTGFNSGVLYICGMNIFRLALELFVLYILYKLVFDFIIPVAKTTKQVKKQFSTMQSEMEEKMKTYTNTQQNQQPSSANNASKPANTDYIEFEEVK